MFWYSSSKDLYSKMVLLELTEITTKVQNSFSFSRYINSMITCKNEKKNKVKLF